MSRQRPHGNHETSIKQSKYKCGERGNCQEGGNESEQQKVWNLQPIETSTSFADK